MSLSPGTRLGTYEILSAIGAGGMGEVYRARDTRLGRDVAVKVLPAAFAADPERLARFRREAQVLASLNHPNIAAIYGLEDAGGTPHLVLELVLGESLATRLARAALPVREALAVCVQIAAAMAPGLLAASGRHPWALGTLGWALGRAGHAEKARAVCDELTARARHEFVSAFWLAAVAAAAGRGEDARRYAERSVAERDPVVVLARLLPQWDYVRELPWFEEVVRGVWG